MDIPSRCFAVSFRPVFAAALLGLAGLVQAATPAPAATAAPTPQTAVDALTRATAAVVGIETQAIAGARSSETLGPRRRGSGVVIGTDGTILTIGYLMLEADQIRITTQDNRQIPARALAYDIATGFGLVRPLSPLRGITPAPLGQVGSLQVGEPLMAVVGAQEGDEPGLAVTQLVSQRAFSGYWEYHIESALFTSPPISSHSGAALFNRNGELMGIGSLFVMDALGDNRQYPGNLFVPVDLLRPILAELRQSGSSRASRRPWLGLSSTVQNGRVQVLRVNPDSPAQQAGLQPGDAVLAVDGTRVTTLEGFYKKLWDRPDPESEVTLQVLQGAEVRNLTLKAVDRMKTLLRPSGI